MSSRKTSSIQLGENSTSGEYFFQGGLPIVRIQQAIYAEPETQGFNSLQPNDHNVHPLKHRVPR